jgi:Nif-specific regulatory protein
MADLINGRYRVRSRLGEGGMGTVLLAEDTARGGALVALKQVDPANGPPAGKELTDALIREFETLARLRHPNLPLVHDFGHLGGTRGVFISMEYVEGQDLIAASPSLSPDRTLAIIAQVCRALEFIHTRGLVHRDLKPQNILVTQPEASIPRAVLVDFGLASPVKEEAMMRGTLQFVAPEILKSQRLDRRADLYALGVLLFRLCTGRCPFQGSSREVLKGHLELAPPRPADVLAPDAEAPLRPALNDALSSVILKLLEKEPARRYSTAAETLQAINRATGSDHPIETADTGEAYSASAALVGRESEMSTMESALDRLRRQLQKEGADREGVVVLVVGDAGSGKSRFQVEARRRAQVRGFRAVSVACTSEAPAFQPVTEAIALLGGPAPALFVEEMAQSGSSEKARLRAVDAASTALASRTTSQPAVVFLDDAHLADEGTLAVVESLARSAARAPAVGLVLAYRSEEIEGSPLQSCLGRLGRYAQNVEIHLAPLDHERTSEMIGGMLGLPEAPEVLVDLVHRETSGNPLFIEHAVRSLLEDGTISRLGTSFRADVDALTRISFPMGIGEVIRKRLGRLSADARRSLEILAVLGRAADLELVQVAGGDELTKGRIEAAVESLRQMRIVVEQVGERAPLYVIPNGRIRDVVYERTDWDRRRELHHRLAKVLEERSERGEPIRYEELARHFIHGAEAPVALAYAAEAADRCRRMGAGVEAIGFYRRALELVEPGADVQRAEILCKVGLIEKEFGRDAQALDSFEGSLRAAEAAGRHDLAAQARLEKADLLLRRGRSDEAIREIERSLETVAGGKHLSLEARAYSHLAGAHVRSGRLDRGLDLQERALAAAEKSGDKARIAAALNNLASLYCFTAQNEKGFEAFERAIAIRQEMKDRNGELETTSNMGTRLAEAGHKEKAIGCLDRCVSLARAVNDLHTLVEAQINLGFARLDQGVIDLSLSSFEEAAAVAIRIGHEFQASYALDGWGLALRALGDLEGAMSRHAEALERARRSEDPVQEMYALGSLAQDHALATDETKAREYLRRALRVQSSAATPRARARLLDAQALIHLESGAVLEAETTAHELGELARQESLAEEEASSHRLAALALEAKGDREAALRALDKAVEISRANEAHEILWRSLSALDSLGGGRGRGEGGKSAGAEACEVIRGMASRIADEEIRKRYLAAADRSQVLSRHHTSAITLPAPGAGGALSALYRISEIITSSTDLDDLLSRVLDLALEIVRAERGLIILVDEDGERQEIRAARGVEPETIADALEYSHSVVKEAAAGRTLVMVDPESEQAFRRFRSVSMFHIKSLACVPMKVRNRILGTVYLDSRKQGYVFGEEDLEFLRAFANLAGAALELARANAVLSSENVTLHREVQDLRKAAGRRSRYQELVGKTVRMQAVYDLLDKVSASTLPVLITGESGTGKELVARAIHFGGPRRDRRFFSENVAAIPDTLLESELFGHVRGAFTGADRDRKGVFELASGGSLFLDEIGDMSLPLQSKVLRALQDGEIRPLGAKSSAKVDVRVISATNRDLEAMVAEERFREDLYYRLNVVRIHMPPLRERKEDIPLLVDHFLSRAAEAGSTERKKLDISALQLLLRYDWPGNVRELENELLKLAVLTSREVITQQDLASEPELFDKLTRIDSRAPEFPRLSDMERRQIEKALAAAGGNRAKAAQMLGISRATIYRKLREHGISG